VLVPGEFNDDVGPPRAIPKVFLPILIAVIGGGVPARRSRRGARRSSRVALAEVAFLIGVGALLCLISLFWVWRVRRFLATAVDVDGTVLGHEPRASTSSSGSGSSITYHPVVQFATTEGQAVQFTDSVGGSPPSHDVGETVRVKYDPGDPADARIATGFRLWFGPGLVGLLGVGFLVAGVIVLVVA
jgi:hypothetical protein